MRGGAGESRFLLILILIELIFERLHLFALVFDHLTLDGGDRGASGGPLLLQPFFLFGVGDDGSDEHSGEGAGSGTDGGPVTSAGHCPDTCSGGGPAHHPNARAGGNATARTDSFAFGGGGGGGHELGTVLFHVGTDGGQSIIERLDGGALFGVVIFQFTSGAEEGGWRGGGFANKDRFKGGHAGEGQKVGLEGDPPAGAASGVAECPPAFEGGAGGKNIFGRRKIEDFSRGKIVGEKDFRNEATMILGEILLGRGRNDGGEEDIFFGAKRDGVVDGDVIFFEAKPAGLEGEELDLLGKTASENRAGEALGGEVAPAQPRAEGGGIRGGCGREDGEGGGGGAGGEAD